MQIRNEIKKILFQNVFIPFVMGIGASCFMIAIIYKANELTNWINHTEDVMQKVTNIHRIISDAQAGERGYILHNSPIFLDSYNIANSTADSLTSELLILVKDNPTQSTRVRDLKPLLLDFFRTTQEVIEQSKTLSKTSLTQMSTINERKAIDLRKRLQQIYDEENLLKETRNTEQEIFFKYSALFFVPFLLLGNAFISYRGRKSVLNISDSYEAKLVDNNRQLALLEKDHWLRECESNLSNRLLKTDSIHEMSIEMINYFIENFNALAGTVFARTLNESNNYVCIASIGVDHSTAHFSELRSETSLMNKVLLSKQPELFKDFANDSWNLKSSLGHHKPQYILSAPIRHLDKNLAVIEFAFNHQPETKLLDFLTTVSEKLGSLLSNEMSKEALGKLYDELHRKSEELKSQQEELRVSNEELEQRAYLLRESQQNLESKNVELEEVNSLLQEQARNLEEQKHQMNQHNQELVKARSELERQTKELEKTSEYKSQFLANMSHELRTPLNSSMILAQLLLENKDHNLNAKQIEYAKQILKSGQDLLSLINDILDLSKVESGLLDINSSHFAINDMVQSLTGTFTPIAQRKNILLKIENTCDLTHMDSDRLRLEQILSNLLSNAIKFTHQGTVTLFISKSGNKKTPTVTFAVHDTGIGISENKQEQIFEPFKQADETVTRKYGGTGLGLSISRQLADLLGGHLTVKSKLGSGSTFICEVPATLNTIASNQKILNSYKLNGYHKIETDKFFESTNKSFKSSEIQTNEAKSSGLIDDDRNTQNNKLKVLVIEDDEPFAKILRDHIRESGYDCLIATNAQEGQSLAFSQKPTAIILDINLPDYSGLAVLEQLKSNLFTRHIPVHIISVEDKSAQAFKLGAAQYLVKPLSIDKIRNFINKLATDSLTTNKRVLLIEDDNIQAKAITELLHTPNVFIDVVNSGHSAKEVLNSNTKFDCIILDLKLPDMSGFQLLRNLSDEGILDNCPPIIVHTAVDLTRTEELELKELTNLVIVKGVSSQERLIDEVSIFLHQSIEQVPTHRVKMLENLNARKTSLKGQKILLVDDDLRNVFALTAALELSGAKIDMAQNGNEALVKLKDKSDYNIVLMDIMMPVMDGYEATRRIRSDLKLKDLPIIALTAKAMKNDRESCIKAGANDYLVKPIDIEKLTSLIRVWTNKIL